MGNNKIIGVILIIVGIAFIALGVWAGMKNTQAQLPSIYSEQNNDNTQVNDVTESIYKENVNVYTELDEQESARYIY